MKRAVLPALLGVVLCGCSTVSGWFGGGDDGADDDEAPAAAAAPATARDGPGAAPSRRVAADRSSHRPQEEIRRELRAVEADAQAGRLSVKEAWKRSADLRAELEESVRAEHPAAAARKGGKDGGGTARRLDALEARLDDLARRVEAIESSRGAQR